MMSKNFFTVGAFWQCTSGTCNRGWDGLSAPICVHQIHCFRLTGIPLRPIARGDQLVMVGSECLIGMSLLQAKQVLEQAPPVVELVAQRKESPKQSPALAPKTEARAQRIGREESREDVEKRGKSEKIEVPSFPVTELPTPPSPLPPPPTSGKTGELRPAPQFSQTISQSEMQTRLSTISTSLAYATGNVNLNASWNVSMSGT